MKTLREFISGRAGKVPYADVLHPSDTLGIPRDLMPQIPQVAQKNFIKYVLKMGIPVEEIPNCSIGAIKLTQGNIDLIKVRQMIDSLDGIESGEFSKVWIISSDWRLLDGHHSFLAAFYSGEILEVPVIRIGITIRGLIPLAHKFMKKYDSSKSIKESRSFVMSEDESKYYRGLRKAYREMSFYQHKARNHGTPYAKKKFMGTYQKWTEAVRGVRKAFGTERAKGIVRFAINKAESNIALTK